MASCKQCGPEYDRGYLDGCKKKRFEYDGRIQELEEDKQALALEVADARRETARECADICEDSADRVEARNRIVTKYELWRLKDGDE